MSDIDKWYEMIFRVGNDNEPVVSNSIVKKRVQRHPEYDDDPSIVYEKLGHNIDTNINLEIKGTLCPKCNKHSVVFTHKQLRSADEGANVIYKCIRPGCNYKKIQ